MEVAPVDERDIDCSPAEGEHRLEPAEAAADHHDSMSVVGHGHATYPTEPAVPKLAARPSVASLVAQARRKVITWLNSVFAPWWMTRWVRSFRVLAEVPPRRAAEGETDRLAMAGRNPDRSGRHSATGDRQYDRDLAYAAAGSIAADGHANAALAVRHRAYPSMGMGLRPPSRERDR